MNRQALQSSHGGCHGGAVTIGSHGECDTFIPMDMKGGLDVLARVGACSRTDCAHNVALECAASSVEVGPVDHAAGCRCFTPR